MKKETKSTIVAFAVLFAIAFAVGGAIAFFDGDESSREVNILQEVKLHAEGSWGKASPKEVIDLYDEYGDLLDSSDKITIYDGYSKGVLLRIGESETPHLFHTAEFHEAVRTVLFDFLHSTECDAVIEAAYNATSEEEAALMVDKSLEEYDFDSRIIIHLYKQVQNERLEQNEKN